jgi:hypothetical protein
MNSDHRRGGGTESRLPKQGGFETRPYKSLGLRCLDFQRIAPGDER